MTFIYNISDTTDTSSQMRLELGDNIFEDGILPDGNNFDDAELDYFYDAENDDFWSAVARAFEAAAARWGAYPSFVKMGPESQSIPAAKFYAQKAEIARTKAGSAGRPSSITLTKVDYGIDTS